QKRGGRPPEKASRSGLTDPPLTEPVTEPSLVGVLVKLNTSGPSAPSSDPKPIKRMPAGESDVFLTVPVFAPSTVNVVPAGYFMTSLPLAVLVSVAVPNVTPTLSNVAKAPTVAVMVLFCTS